MNERKLCPMKFGRIGSGECEREKCMWFRVPMKDDDDGACEITIGGEVMNYEP